MKAFEPRQYLELAEELLKRENAAENAAALRSAVSRAYYSAFLATKEVAARRGVYFRSTHEQFWDDLSRQGFKELAECGTGLRKWRNEADYRVDLELKAWKAQYCVVRAKRIFELLEDAGATSQPVCKSSPVLRQGDRARFAELRNDRPRPGRPE